MRRTGGDDRLNGEGIVSRFSALGAIVSNFSAHIVSRFSALIVRAIAAVRDLLSTAHSSKKQQTEQFVSVVVGCEPTSSLFVQDGAPSCEVEVASCIDVGERLIDKPAQLPTPIIESEATPSRVNSASTEQYAVATQQPSSEELRVDDHVARSAQELHMPPEALMLTLDELMTECDSVKKQCLYQIIIDGLKRELADIKNDFSEKKVDKAIARLEAKINLRASCGDLTHLSYAAFIASPDVQLYMRAREALTRLKNYVNAESEATVIHAQSSVVVSKVSMFAQSAAATETITLGDLIERVNAHTVSADADADVHMASAALGVKLNDFKSRHISASELATYIFKELNIIHCASDRFGKLKCHFESVCDLLNRMAFSSGNCANNHFVDSVERLDGRYKIHGRNRYNEPRFIIINDDGSVEGKSGATLGIIEQKMYDSRVEIFRHFNIALPESYSTPMARR